MLLCFSLCFLCVCSAPIKEGEKDGGGSTPGNIPEKEAELGLSVNYIDVEQGDSILVNFPDGKNMLIDCGNGETRITKAIIDYLNSRNVSTIDWFVITHPDVDHVGGAVEVINAFEIKNAFVPDILDINKIYFPRFKSAYDLLVEKNVDIKYSDNYKFIKGDDYSIVFLSPLPLELGGSYQKLNMALVPTENETNDVSPIMLLEYKGVRFLFTGDAGKEQEAFVMENYAVGLYQKTFGGYGISVKLEDIDFLKVSHHGASGASSLKFLELIKPKNAVLSVGGSNNYGHPSLTTLYNLETVNENYNLYRTDVHGTVCVFVSEEGAVSVR